MIGKVMVGKSFGGCIAYCLENKKWSQQKKQNEGEERPVRNRAEVLCYHHCFGNKKELTNQLREVARLHPRNNKPVLHITLSFAPCEKVEGSRLQILIAACAKEMGFDKNQYLAVAHNDTKHQHLHIIANRIGFDGRVVPDSHNYKRMAKFCRQMEKELGLQPVLSPRMFLPAEERQQPRNDSRKMRLQSRIQQAMKRATSLVQFEALMKSEGYRVERGRGIAFTDPEGVRTKGSEVGFSLRRLEEMFAQKVAEKIPQKALQTATGIPAKETKGSSLSERKIVENMEQKKPAAGPKVLLKKDGNGEVAQPDPQQKKYEQKHKPGR